MASFGSRLKELRLENNLTQEELGNNFELHKTRISQYELNKRQADDDMKKKFAEFFNVSLDYLLCNTDIREKADTLLKDHIVDVPKSYSDKYKITSRDKKQYELEMKKANEAFFMNDELNEDAKKEMLDLMSELFWKAKDMNKRKK